MTRAKISHSRKITRQYERGYAAGCEYTHEFWYTVLHSTKGVGEKTRQKLMDRAKEVAAERLLKQI